MHHPDVRAQNHLLAVSRVCVTVRQCVNKRGLSSSDCILMHEILAVFVGVASYILDTSCPAKAD